MRRITTKKTRVSILAREKGFLSFLSIVLSCETESHVQPLFIPQWEFFSFEICFEWRTRESSSDSVVRNWNNNSWPDSGQGLERRWRDFKDAPGNRKQLLCVFPPLIATRWVITEGNIGHIADDVAVACLAFQFTSHFQSLKILITQTVLLISIFNCNCDETRGEWIRGFKEIKLMMTHVRFAMILPICLFSLLSIFQEDFVSIFFSNPQKSLKNLWWAMGFFHPSRLSLRATSFPFQKDFLQHCLLAFNEEWKSRELTINSRAEFRSLVHKSFCCCENEKFRGWAGWGWKKTFSDCDINGKNCRTFCSNNNFPPRWTFLRAGVGGNKQFHFNKGFHFAGFLFLISRGFRLLFAFERWMQMWALRDKNFRWTPTGERIKSNFWIKLR